MKLQEPSTDLMVVENTEYWWVTLLRLLVHNLQLTVCSESESLVKLLTGNLFLNQTDAQDKEFIKW